MTHLQACVVHPFKGSTSTACNWQMKEIKMLFSSKATDVGRFLLGTREKDFPEVEVIYSEALKRQIRGIKPIQGRF